MSRVKLITGSSQQQLAKSLAENISAAPLPPLEDEVIVVLSIGMARWLSTQLASDLGVAAGIKFLFPNELLDTCFRAIMPDASASISFAVPGLTWRIAAELPELSGSDGFEHVAAYLGTSMDDRRLLQLSRSIASCFDQYIIFRPETVLAWDRGSGNDWQARLWRRVCSRIKGRHRASLLYSLAEHAAKKLPPLEPLPRRISFFGISYLPPFHLKALSLISPYTDASFYLMNPCEEYWGNLVSRKSISRIIGAQSESDYYETGNPLLSSLGRLGQDFIESLLEHDFADDTITPHRLSPTEETSNSLLSCIQNDILTLYDPTAQSGERRKLSDGNDSSVSVHSCHSPLREMEVLHDNLLALFDKLPALEPRQIIVMIPDIERYAPFISAVFGDRSSGRPRLPFTIADRSVQRTSAYVGAFIALLDFATSRLTLEETLSFLELSPVMNRFELDEDDLSSLRLYLLESGVRWGFDEGHRVELGFPSYEDFSWRQGIDRMLLGYAFSPDHTSSFNGVSPAHAFSGSAAVVLGKIATFISTLHRIRERFNSNHTISVWINILKTSAEELFQPSDADSNGTATVARALSSVGDAGIAAGFKRSLSISTVKDLLTAEINGNSGAGHGFLGGGVTFCAMMPMRSIPMRVIWLAGMNDGSFPRTERHPGFSLLSGERRRGDRSLRDEDRYIFLEALMAATDSLQISYVGQSNRDNSLTPPSILVSELSEYISRGYRGADGVTPHQVEIRHPLQSFSLKYFNNKDPERLFSYDSDTLRALRGRYSSPISRPIFIDGPLPATDSVDKNVTLQDLAQFLRNTSASFLRERLGIRLRNSADLLPDSEPFLINSLEQHTLSRELIKRILGGDSREECLTSVRSCGLLPPMTAGLSTFDGLWRHCRSFADRIGPLLGREPQIVKVLLCHRRIKLHAMLEVRDNVPHLHWTPGKMKGKDRLRLWLEHLLLNGATAGLQPRISRLVAADGVLDFKPVENADDLLKDLIDLYCEGETRPLPFFAESSWAYVCEGIGKAQERWRGNERTGVPGEGSDSSTALCFGSGEPLAGDEFKILAERVYRPMLMAINPSDGSADAAA